MVCVVSGIEACRKAKGNERADWKVFELVRVKQSGNSKEKQTSTRRSGSRSKAVHWPQREMQLIDEYYNHLILSLFSEASMSLDRRARRVSSRLALTIHQFIIFR